MKALKQIEVYLSLVLLLIFFIPPILSLDFQGQVPMTFEEVPILIDQAADNKAEPLPASKQLLLNTTSAIYKYKIVSIICALTIILAFISVPLMRTSAIISGLLSLLAFAITKKLGVLAAGYYVMALMGLSLLLVPIIMGIIGKVKSSK